MNDNDDDDIFKLKFGGMNNKTCSLIKFILYTITNSKNIIIYNEILQ